MGAPEVTAQRWGLLSQVAHEVSGSYGLMIGPPLLRADEVAE
jgi:hypothetical protein